MQNVYSMMQHTGFTSVLYFQNVIQFYRTLVNLISFMHIKSGLLSTDFHKTNKCSTLCAHLLYQIKPKLGNKCMYVHTRACTHAHTHIYIYIYSFTPSNKVWLPLC